MKAFFSALFVSVLLSACATTYVGPHPDFTKAGPEATAEYQKFEAGTSYGNFNYHGVKMGGEVYYRESVERIIQEVSPAATEKMEQMEIGQNISWAIFAATIFAIYQPRDSWANQTGYYIGLGALLGTGIYINVVGMNAAEDYNKDLKSKFSPSLAFSTTF